MAELDFAVVRRCERARVGLEAGQSKDFVSGDEDGEAVGVWEGFGDGDDFVCAAGFGGHFRGEQLAA